MLIEQEFPDEEAARVELKRHGFTEDQGIGPHGRRILKRVDSSQLATIRQDEDGRTFGKIWPLLW